LQLKVALFGGSVVAQLIGISLLPRTHGFSRPGYTLVCVLVFLIGFTLVAKLTYSGMSLGIMMPAMAAVVPLGTIAIGVLLYREKTSATRIGFLVGACILIGIANKLR
jgi:multidrug transporter EmrE-like cation transporter